MEATTYTAAVQSLYALGQELVDKPGQPRRKWELAHMRTLCAALGDPQTMFPSVLIAGTNGKGSTASTLASIVQAAGYKTALYTSPHLARINERLKINGADIDDDTFARLYFHVNDTAQRLVREEALPHPPSFFEVITALAFLYFAEQKVELAVLEVGLGGRLDATNIVEPLLSIITDIALDHTDYLGTTITAIAREKAGILRPNGTLVTLPQHPEANQSIGETAVALNVTGINAADFMPDRGQPLEPFTTLDARFRNHYKLVVFGEEIVIDSSLAGSHQQRNLALAIAAAATLTAPNLCNVHSYNITGTAISQGIRNTVWPGRLELIAPNILLDVAHNPAGAWTLRSALTPIPDAMPKTLIFSCLRDKALSEMAKILFPLFEGPHDRIFVVPINNPRAASVDEILATARALDTKAEAAPTIEAAIATALAETPKDGLIVATGSVYLIGELREHLLHMKETNP